MFSVECSMFDVHSQVSPLINPSALGGTPFPAFRKLECAGNMPPTASCY